MKARTINQIAKDYDGMIAEHYERLIELFDIDAPEDLLREYELLKKSIGKEASFLYYEAKQRLDDIRQENVDALYAAEKEREKVMARANTAVFYWDWEDCGSEGVFVRSSLTGYDEYGVMFSIEYDNSGSVTTDRAIAKNKAKAMGLRFVDDVDKDRSRELREAKLAHYRNWVR